MIAVSPPERKRPRARPSILETVAHERGGALRLFEADWEAWNRHPRLGGDWRWRDASNNLRPG
jgi:beta-galactosidase/beta-glucuronidase